MKSNKEKLKELQDIVDDFNKSKQEIKSLLDIIDSLNDSNEFIEFKNKVDNEWEKLNNLEQSYYKLALEIKRNK